MHIIDSGQHIIILITNKHSSRHCYHHAPEATGNNDALDLQISSTGTLISEQWHPGSQFLWLGSGVDYGIPISSTFDTTVTGVSQLTGTDDAGRYPHNQSLWALSANNYPSLTPIDVTFAPFANNRVFSYWAVVRTSNLGVPACKIQLFDTEERASTRPVVIPSGADSNAKIMLIPLGTMQTLRGPNCRLVAQWLTTPSTIGSLYINYIVALDVMERDAQAVLFETDGTDNLGRLLIEPDLRERPSTSVNVPYRGDISRIRSSGENLYVRMIAPSDDYWSRPRMTSGNTVTRAGMAVTARRWDIHRMMY